MEKRSVAIVTPGTFALPSNKSSSVERVVEYVSKEMKHEADIHLFARKNRHQTKRQRISGIYFHRFPRANSQAYLNAVRNELRVVWPSLIQIENRPHFVSAIKRAFPHIPLWLSLHSTTFISSPGISRARLKMNMQKADLIIVNSRFLKNELLRINPMPEERIQINYLGVDPEQFPSKWLPAQAAIRQKRLSELGYEGKKIILYVGRLIPIKGVHHLLNVVPDIIQRHPDAVFVLVGGAFYGSNRLTDYVIGLHKQGKRYPAHVRFVPYTSYEKMADWYNIADIVVVPSFEKEAFGLVNVEAMAAGLPVVATNAGGIREVIVHEKTGFLLEPHSIEQDLVLYLTELLDHPQVCRMQGENGRSRMLELFTWQATARRQLELMQTYLS